MRSARKLLLAGLGLVLLIISQTATTFADVTAGSTTSVVVLPHASDYQFSMTQDVGSGPISQGTIITYTINYGALQSSGITADTTISANFTQDSLDGVTHVTDYVVGSATNAYNNTVPVVDLVNRKITWNISQLPAGTTDQVVTFQLRTNANYIGTTYVPITVKADFSNTYITMPQQSISTQYGYHTPNPSNSSSTPTPTPTSVPSITPTSSITPFIITNIDFSEITPSETTIHVETTAKTRLSVLYGLSPNAMFQTFLDTNLDFSHDIHLTKLTPQTTYFLKVMATDENGSNIHSDIITFTTPISPSSVHVEQQSIILVSGNSPLINTNPLLPFAQVLIPHTQDFTVGLRVSSPQTIKTILAFLENSQVLGTNTFSYNTSITSAPMIQQQPGVYIAQLTAPAIPSIYDVYAKISDIHGNITQTKIAEAIVYGPIHVIDGTRQTGIDHTRIFLSFYNAAKKIYEPIFPSDIQENPIYTDKNGFAVIHTGEGKYKMVVSQYGYTPQTIYFSIDKSHLSPPVVNLQSIGFSIGGFIQYYTDTANDFVQLTIAGFSSVSEGFRFFKLISILVVLSFVAVSFLLFLIRTKLSLVVIPLFIKHHTQKVGTVSGQILDAITHKPIPLSIVAISNKLSHEVLGTTTSNNKGIFYLKSDWVNSENNLNILAQGYRTNKFAVNKDLFPAVIYLQHNIVGGPLHNPIIATIIRFLGLLFETSLVISLILEIFFISTIGLWGLLFMAISLLNLLLWILYQRSEKP